MANTDTNFIIINNMKDLIGIAYNHNDSLIDIQQMLYDIFGLIISKLTVFTRSNAIEVNTMDNEIGLETTNFNINNPIEIEIKK